MECSSIAIGVQLVNFTPKKISTDTEPHVIKHFYSGEEMSFSRSQQDRRHRVVKFQFQLNLKNRSDACSRRPIRSYLHVLYEPFHPVLFLQFHNQNPRKIVGAAIELKKNNWTRRHLHAVIDQYFFSNVTFACFRLFFVKILECFSV